jgi:hypothetical protein
LTESVCSPIIRYASVLVTVKNCIRNVCLWGWCHAFYYEGKSLVNVRLDRTHCGLPMQSSARPIQS